MGKKSKVPKWLKKIFAPDKADFDVTVPTPEEEKEMMTGARVLAFEMCVQRIARALSKCEFRVYENSKEQRNDFYYLLNIRPNCNETAKDFWFKFIHKLYYQDEVLIVPIPDRGTNKTRLYIADQFEHDESNVLKPQIFRNIGIGKLTLRKTFSMDEVFYFRSHNHNTRIFLDETLGMTLSLMIAAERSYRRANGSKWKLTVNRIGENKDDRDENFRDAQNKKLRSFIQGNDTVWMATKGQDIEPLSTGGTASDTRDIKALLDDVLELTCKAFLMPTNIMTGEVTDTSKALDDFFTFCLDPVIELIQTELNAAHYTEAESKQGHHVKIDTQTIRHVDVLAMAGNVDKLLSSGVFTVNDILRILGYERIDDEWADKHFMTKNYSLVDEILNEIDRQTKKGGIPDEDENNAGQNADQSEDGNGSAAGPV